MNIISVVIVYGIVCAAPFLWATPQEDLWAGIEMGNVGMVEWALAHDADINLAEVATPNNLPVRVGSPIIRALLKFNVVINRAICDMYGIDELCSMAGLCSIFLGAVDSFYAQSLHGIVTGVGLSGVGLVWVKFFRSLYDMKDINAQYTIINLLIDHPTFDKNYHQEVIGISVIDCVQKQYAELVKCVQSYPCYFANRIVVNRCIVMYANIIVRLKCK